MTLRLPKTSDAHLLADFVEFAVFVGHEIVSPSDLQAERRRQAELERARGGNDRVKDEEELPELAEQIELQELERELLGLTSDEAAESVALEQLADEDVDAGDEPLDEELGELAGDAAAYTPSRDDARSAEANDVGRQLLFRADAFGDSYPFEVDLATHALELREASPDRLLYLSLLIGANLSHLPPSARQHVAKWFEQATASVLQRFLGSAEVHIFGTSDGGSGRYTGDLAQKLKLLAKDIRFDLAIDDEGISTHNFGDRGLDVVAWFDPLDAADTLVLIFAQATCQKGWLDKQHEAAEGAWSRIFTILCPITNVVFVPYCWRSVTGRWFDPLKLEKGVIFDRLRIMLVIRGHAADIPLPTNAIAETVARPLTELAEAL